MKKTVAIVIPYDEVRYLEVDVPEGADFHDTALDQAQVAGTVDIADPPSEICVIDADALRIYRRGWISTVAVQERDRTWEEPLDPNRPHPFQGILAGTPDRPCTLCHRPDRDPIHTPPILHKT